MEIKELQKSYKTLKTLILTIEKQLDEIEGKKVKHVDRLKAHDTEVQLAEQKVTTIIEKLARDEASERDLDKAQDNLDSLQGKRKNLQGILTVIENDSVPLMQQKAQSEAELKKTENKIISMINDQIKETVTEQILTGYAVHLRHLEGSMMGCSFMDYCRMLSESMRPSKLDTVSLRPRADKIISEFF